MPRVDRASARILMVDDNDQNLRLLDRILRTAGFRNMTGTDDSREVLALYESGSPDLVLVDLQMPHIDGYEILRQLGPRPDPACPVPVLVITGDATAEARNRALELGARDFVTKPFDAVEVVLRIDNQLRTRSLQLDLERRNQELERRVEERTRRLREAQRDMVHRLALASEFRDDDTGDHARRVGLLACRIGKELGLDDRTVARLGEAALLHDVGKIGIPDAVLLKPGKLTDQEFELIKTHATIGARILGGSDSPMLQMAESIALYHHENWDGSGYAGLKGEQIPLVARIVAVADVYDALSSDRPYRPAWPHERILEEIRSQCGRKFEPRIVEAFLRLSDTDAPAKPAERQEGDAAA